MPATDMSARLPARDRSSPRLRPDVVLRRAYPAALASLLSVQVIHLLGQMMGATQPTNRTSTGLAIAAMLGLAFVAWRSWRLTIGLGDLVVLTSAVVAALASQALAVRVADDLVMGVTTVAALLMAAAGMLRPVALGPFALVVLLAHAAGTWWTVPSATPMLLVDDAVQLAGLAGVASVLVGALNHSDRRSAAIHQARLDLALAQTRAKAEGHVLARTQRLLHDQVINALLVVSGRRRPPVGGPATAAASALEHLDPWLAQDHRG